MADSNLSPHTYTMNGVEVSFPAKAYPSQVAMMSKVTQVNFIISDFLWWIIQTPKKSGFYNPQVVLE